MCGIAGIFATTPKSQKELGDKLITMLESLECRGPDSAGIALFHAPKKGELVARVMLPENHGGEEAEVKAIKKAMGTKAKVLKSARTEKILRLAIKSKLEPKALTALIEGAVEGSEVISLGEGLEVVKQVGSPESLDEKFKISAMSGSHAIGHTRLSTESKIDISHSQPFWAHGVLDMATVHNGHITNHHKLKRIYEQQGVKFYTENDSELLGIYLSDKMRQGLSLRQALEKSIQELDGSFCYLVATENEFAYVKDRFCLKPLVVGEGEGVVAIATEEIALRKAYPDLRLAKEPDGQSIRIWSRHAKN